MRPAINSLLITHDNVYNTEILGLTAKKNNEMDGAVFCTGLHTFIKQLNFDLGKIYIEFMCKYAVHLSKYAMS